MGNCLSNDEVSNAQPRRQADNESRRRASNRERNSERRGNPPRSSRAQQTTQNPRASGIGEVRRTSVSGGPVVGTNKPLVKLQDYQEWSTDSPITREQLAKQRSEFWETQPKYSGLEVIQNSLNDRLCGMA